MVNLEIIHGYSGDKQGQYGPDDDVSRGAAAKFFANALLKLNVLGFDTSTKKYVIDKNDPLSELKQCTGNEFEGMPPVFNDVDNNHTFCNYIRVVKDLGIIHGYSGDREGNYGPDDPLTREAAAKFVANSLDRIGGVIDGLKACETDPNHKDYNVFTDVNQAVVPSFCTYIRTIKDLDIIHGFRDGSYQPARVVQRAGMAKFIYGVLHTVNPTKYKKPLESNVIRKFSDTTNGVAIVQHDNGTVLQVNNSLSNNPINGFFGSNFEFWLANSESIVHYQAVSDTETRYTVDQGLPHNIINTVAANPNNGDVWVGTPAGAAKFSNNAWLTYTNANGLADNYVSAIAISPSGVVWFGTPQGITKFDDQWVSYTETNGLPNNQIVALAVDSDESLWGIAGNELLFRYDGTTWETFRLPRNDIFDIAVVNGVVYLSTNDGLIQYKNKSFFSDDLDVSLKSITIAPDNKLWAITKSGGIGIYEDGQWLVVPFEKSENVVFLPVVLK